MSRDVVTRLSRCFLHSIFCCSQAEGRRRGWACLVTEERQGGLAAFLSCAPQHQSVDRPCLLHVARTAVMLALGQGTRRRHRQGRQGAGDMTLAQAGRLQGGGTPFGAEQGFGVQPGELQLPWRLAAHHSMAWQVVMLSKPQLPWWMAADHSMVAHRELLHVVSVGAQAGHEPRVPRLQDACGVQVLPNVSWPGLQTMLPAGLQGIEHMFSLWECRCCPCQSARSALLSSVRGLKGF